jgi:hypothetical protein
VRRTNSTRVTRAFLKARVTPSGAGLIMTARAARAAGQIQTVGGGSGRHFCAVFCDGSTITSTGRASRPQTREVLERLCCLCLR